MHKELDDQEVCNKCQNKWIRNGRTQELYISASGDVYRQYPRDLFDKQIVSCHNTRQCNNLFTCKHTHSDFEEKLWRDEQEILRSVLKPRSIFQTSLKGTLASICKDMCREGHCMKKQNCFFPHSSKELAKLQAMIEHANKDETISGIYHMHFWSTCIQNNK